MFRKQKRDRQTSLWVASNEVAASPSDPFYCKLAEVLDSEGFGEKVREFCEPYYETERSDGRPGTDPEVFIKMHLVGFFEGIRSNRGIALRCADSISIRSFLGYELTESTPVHSTLSLISKRLPLEVHRKCFGLVLAMLDAHGLLKAENLGIDASTIEANASLKNLEHRMSGETYAEYIRGLAEKEGVDPSDEAAVRNFDRKRPGRKTSNKEWKNPHDPEAKVGRTKRGSTDMIYKVEHTVDLDTGAIVDVDVRPGDEADTDRFCERLMGIEERVNTALGFEPDIATFQSVTADKGYFSLSEQVNLDRLEFRTHIADPHQSRRRTDFLGTEARRALKNARRRTETKIGKLRMRLRAEHVERSFAHVLDSGGARRTTRRGRENIAKQYLLQVTGANLSLLMRTLFGIGTPRQSIGRMATLIASHLLWMLSTLPRYRVEKADRRFIIMADTSQPNYRRGQMWPHIPHLRLLAA